MKPIRLSAHAQSYHARRGFTADEVEETIRTSAWEKAEPDEIVVITVYVYYY